MATRTNTGITPLVTPAGRTIDPGASFNDKDIPPTLLRSWEVAGSVSRPVQRKAPKQQNSEES